MQIDKRLRLRMKNEIRTLTYKVDKFDENGKWLYSDEYETEIENDMDFLRQISLEIDFDNDNYLDWISQIKDYCKHNSCYALAPVQIGIPKRLIYLRNTNPDMKNNENSDYDEESILINPVIISVKGKTRFLEGCESCLNLVGTVDRPYSIEVSYFDIMGGKKQETFSGFKATVFSHEYDHLNGVLHIDLASDVREMSYEEKKQYRSEHPYEIISKEEEYNRNMKV